MDETLLFASYNGYSTQSIDVWLFIVCIVLWVVCMLVCILLDVVKSFAFSKPGLYWTYTVYLYYTIILYSVEWWSSKRMLYLKIDCVNNKNEQNRKNRKPKQRINLCLMDYTIYWIEAFSLWTCLFWINVSDLFQNREKKNKCWNKCAMHVFTVLFFVLNQQINGFSSRVVRFCTALSYKHFINAVRI